LTGLSNRTDFLQHLDAALSQARRAEDSAVAMHVGERICELLRRPLQCGDVEMSINASVGVALAAANDSAESLPHRADEATYLRQTQRQGPRSQRPRPSSAAQKSAKGDVRKVGEALMGSEAT
jgi:GGDEF domain-containing protein